jgi:putative (di)nucleoside polyphosphate hydrolase
MGNIVFRAGVGALIINSGGKVMAFRRSDMNDAWQLPQGGLKEKEDHIEALFREVFEETAIARENLRLLKEYPEWLAYELPEGLRDRKKFRGQVQKWFLLRFTGDERKIDLDRARDDEFDAWQWMTLAGLVGRTVFFKRHIYRKLAREFNPMKIIFVK